MNIILGLLATMLLSALLLKRKSKAPDIKKVLPPGPNGLPILGYLPFIGHLPHITYKKLSATYGPIVRVKMGSTNVVVLHSVKLIKEGLNNDAVLARPSYLLHKRIGMDGIVSMSGQPWLDNRRFCLRVLRDLGFGKKSMEEHIREEIAQLCDVLQSRGGEPKAITDVLTSSVSNNITALLFGERFHYNDPRRHFLDKKAVSFAINASFAATLDFLPTLRKLLSYIPSSKTVIAHGILEDMKNCMSKEMTARSERLNANVNKDFIEAYLKEIKKNNGGNASFNLRTLVGNALNLFGAGTNTVRAVMEWLLLNCARDPEGVQRSLQQEVDNVVGQARAPEWEDRHKMPYTIAVIWEMLRWRTIAPLGIIRECLPQNAFDSPRLGHVRSNIVETDKLQFGSMVRNIYVAGDAADRVDRDTSIGGFHVPAGSVVLPNIWAVHHDSKVWEQPLEFNPARFLNEDHTELLPKPAAFMPFSTGRRMCPAETLALMEIFIYLTTIMQRFTLMPKEGNVISMDIYDGLIAIPLHSQEIRFVPR